MKQQWILLLATVGMSLGALADCESDPCACCHGYDSNGNTQTESINNYCSVSELKYACEQTQDPVYPDGSFPCFSGMQRPGMQRDEMVAGSIISFVTSDLCWTLGPCYWCSNSNRHHWLEIVKIYE